MTSPDLFDHALSQDTASQPLAERMRPRTLDEFVGQEHILGPGKILRRAIEADRLFSSIILWGPPGCGKTTLARLIARHTRGHFVTLSAVLAGKADLRKIIAEAQERRKYHRQRTVLFIDEVHRWNKAQQDALLPHVENGTITLIGATTENPYFEVIPALVSRSRVFQLRPLEPHHIHRIVEAALTDPERGYGNRNVVLTPEALDFLTQAARGDARSALNALELAVESTPPDAQGRIVVSLEAVQEAIQQRAVLYDKDGDAHYDTISAFIKSVRGSDPDAALYWLAKMVEAGEDPRFIMRRLLILAAEDIGLADPHALVVVSAAAQALEWVGLPEGVYHLAEATLYLATAPKSNSTKAYFAARDAVRQNPNPDDVPPHLKDPSRDGKALGHGQGYRYPHRAAGHFVRQQYLPDALQGARFYRPSDQGYEREIAQRLAQWWGTRGQAPEEPSTPSSASQPTEPED